MKKLLLLSILSTLMLTQTTQAQEYPRWTFAPKAGLNLSSMAATDQIEAKTRVGFTAGMMCEYHFSQRVGLSIEALYSEQGAKTSANEGPVTDYLQDKNTTVLNYINVPIMVRFYPLKGMSINVGFQPGFKVKAKHIAEADADQPESTYSLWKHTRGLDMSIPMGLSYTLPCGLMFDARYAIGVNSIMKKDQNLFFEHGTNSVFAFTVGWRF